MSLWEEPGLQDRITTLTAAELRVVAGIERLADGNSPVSYWKEIDHESLTVSGHAVAQQMLADVNRIILILVGLAGDLEDRPLRDLLDALEEWRVVQGLVLELLDGTAGFGEIIKHTRLAMEAKSMMLS